MSRLTEADIRQAMVLGRSSGFLLTSSQIAKLPNWPRIDSVIKEAAQTVSCSVAFLKDVAAHNSRFDDKWFVIFWPGYEAQDIIANYSADIAAGNSVGIFLAELKECLLPGYVLINSRPCSIDEQSVAWPQVVTTPRAKLVPLGLGLFWLLISRQVWQRPPSHRTFVFHRCSGEAVLCNDDQQLQLRVVTEPELQNRPGLMGLIYQDLQD